MTGVAGHTTLALLIALALSLILMPIATTLGATLKMQVQPRVFRSSRSPRPISYLGGPALCVAAGLGAFLGGGLERSGIIILGGGFAMLALLFRHNRRRNRPWHPVLVGVLQAGVASGVWWLDFREALPGPTGWLITVFLLVAAANALNMLDNMNGVAGYTAAATAGGLTVLAFMGGNPAAGVVAAALCGACLGFIPYNRRRPKVYLGAGAPEFIGLVLGATALKVGLYFGPLWAPIATVALLAVPFTDTFVALLGRIAGGRPVFSPGIDHVSHRLFRMGFSTRRAARLHALAALAACASVAVALYLGPIFLLVTLFAFTVGALVLMLIEDREQVRTRSGTPVLRYLTYAVLGLIALALPPTALAALDLRAARNAFVEGKNQAALFNVVGAQTAFAQGGALSDRAHSRLSWPLTLPARLLPVVGDNLQAAQAIALAGALLGPAAQEALEAANVFPVGPAGPEIGFNEGRLNTDPWPAAAQALSLAATQVNLALAEVRAADGILLPPMKGVHEEFLREGAAAIQALENAGDAAALLPHFFADNTKRTWFLMIQNPVELRATGGFLGAYGILTAEDGKLSLDEFASNSDLTDLSNPVPATEEFAENYDKFYSRTFWRNANMTPDFPTAARVLSQMWEQNTGQPIDGVIAVDAVGLNQLLAIVGPVEDPEIGLITHENFLPLALNEAYLRFPDKDDRNSFLIPVGQQVWSRLLAGNFSDPRSLILPMGEMVATKRIQMWSPSELDRLKRLGLAGDLRPEEDADYLMVVGQNAAGNKVDFYARRQTTYNVDLTNPAEVRSEVFVAIANDAPTGQEPSYVMGPSLPDDEPGLNRTYTSIYMPRRTLVQEARLNGEPTGVESTTELGLAVTSKFLEIDPQSQASLSVITRSQLVERGHYKLVIQHQPTLNPGQMELNITLPAGAFVHSYSPALQLVGNQLRWSGNLDRSLEFEVRYGSSFGNRSGGVLANP